MFPRATNRALYRSRVSSERELNRVNLFTSDGFKIRRARNHVPCMIVLESLKSLIHCFSPAFMFKHVGMEIEDKVALKEVWKKHTNQEDMILEQIVKDQAQEAWEN